MTIRRTPLRRRGKGAAKWEACRQDSLLVRWVDGTYSSGGDWEWKTVPCEAPHHHPHCSLKVTIWRWDGGEFKTDGDLHHIIARSRAPGRKYDLTNLALVSRHCHSQYANDKGGILWNKQRSSL